MYILEKTRNLMNVIPRVSTLADRRECSADGPYVGLIFWEILLKFAEKVILNGTVIPKLSQNFLLFSQNFQKGTPARDWFFYFGVFAGVVESPHARWRMICYEPFAVTAGIVIGKRDPIFTGPNSDWVGWAAKPTGACMSLETESILDRRRLGRKLGF